MQTPSRLAFIFGIGLLVVSAASPALAKRLDCSKASKQAEQAVCANTRLLNLDEYYQVKFFEIIGALQNLGANDQVDDIRNQARGFLRQRNACGESVSCIEQAYQNEILYLNNVNIQPQARNNQPSPSTPVEPNSNADNSTASQADTTPPDAPEASPLSGTDNQAAENVPDSSQANVAPANDNSQQGVSDSNQSTNSSNSSNGNSNSGEFVLILFVIVAALLIYFLPTIIAFRRNHPNRWLIFVINLAGGITFFGWLLAIVWSCRAIHKSSTGSDGGESGLNLFVNDESLIKVTGTTDKATQLKKLKELLDNGAITQEEFDRLKREVLSASR